MSLVFGRHGSASLAGITANGLTDTTGDMGMVETFQILMTICSMTMFGPECEERNIMARNWPLAICNQQRRRLERTVSRILPDDDKEFFEIGATCVAGQGV